MVKFNKIDLSAMNVRMEKLKKMSPEQKSVMQANINTVFSGGSLRTGVSQKGTSSIFR